MSAMQQIRDRYGVPAKRGARVLYRREDREGTIVGSSDAHLRIRLDGDKRSGRYHPTWMLDYLSPATGEPRP